MTRTTKILIVAGLAGLVFLLGRFTAPAADEASPAEPAAAVEGEDEVWTCPMHAQVRLPESGPCPICGMDLVLADGGAEAPPGQLTLSPAARELARIETAPVRRQPVSRPVRMVGKVTFDETRVQTIAAWVAGRLERLFVDYTGVRVEEGDHLVRLYSPDLLTAQEELLAARERFGDDEASEFLAQSSRRAYAAAREKLLLFGLTEEQVDAVLERGTAEDHVMLTSPATGVVIEKALDVGAYVETGTPIYRIADLGHVWVQLDAYEQDLGWLRYGQDVVVEAEAWPGETFRGRITFIDPIVDERTRTTGVRLHVDNEDGRLKPGMFVRAVVDARLGPDGVVRAQDLTGKWVSPMHPEVIKDGPGTCDVCGMDLVPAEELGLVSSGFTGGEPLVVPTSAVLVTGRRAIVYVEVPDADEPTYAGRIITLGPRAGDRYVVRDGLEEGERVVVDGAFRIDSAMQIRAEPSMMSQPGETELADGPAPEVDLTVLAPLFETYVAVQDALAADDAERARDAALALDTAGVRQALEGAGDVAGARADAIVAAVDVLARAAELEAQRPAFRDLSQELVALVERVGNPLERPLRRVHCPMAFDFEGADWLQPGAEVQNPYFGAEMLRCGTVEEVLDE